MDSILSLIYGLQRGYNSRSAERAAAAAAAARTAEFSRLAVFQAADCRQLRACLHLKMILKRNEDPDRLQDCRGNYPSLGQSGCRDSDIPVEVHHLPTKSLNAKCNNNEPSCYAANAN